MNPRWLSDRNEGRAHTRGSTRVETGARVKVTASEGREEAQQTHEPKKKRNRVDKNKIFIFE